MTSLDPASLARFASRSLDELEADPGVPEGARVADAILIVELTADATSDDGWPLSQVHAFVLSRRDIVGLGLLVRAGHALLAPDTDD
jgi:hypothetical protein